MIDISNPLTWPLFPLLPVTRIGGNPVHDSNDLGIVVSSATCQTMPVVLIVNLGLVGGRALSSLFAEPSIPRETFTDVEALALAWQPD